MIRQHLVRQFHVKMSFYLQFARHTVCKFRKFSPTSKFFRQIDLQYNSLVKKLIWRNFCKKSWGKNLQISTLCSVEKWEILSPWKKFRQINSLVKLLVSRNFCQKSTVWKFENFSPTIFCKNSVKSTFLLKSYTANQFDEKNLQWGKIYEITTLWRGDSESNLLWVKGLTAYYLGC